MKNKKAWIKIVESFVAILLITGVVLVVIDRESVTKEDLSNQIYQSEIRILNSVITDSGIKNKIYTNSAEDTLNSINQIKEQYINCGVEICPINNENCVSAGEIPENRDLYVQSIILKQDNNSKKLKLICWLK